MFGLTSQSRNLSSIDLFCKLTISFVPAGISIQNGLSQSVFYSLVLSETLDELDEEMSIYFDEIRESQSVFYSLVLSAPPPRRSRSGFTY